MRTSATSIKDCLVVEMPRHPDNRGFFQEMYSQRWAMSNNMLTSAIGHVNWQQINWSHSNQNVLRGIHVAPFAKLVTCIAGRIIDYVVDLRPDSASYLDYFSIELSPDNTMQVVIPPGCGHAFFALEPNSTVVYFQSDVYSPLKEWAVRYDDEQLAIQWPIPNPILSDKDAAAKTLKEVLADREKRLVSDKAQRERHKEWIKQEQSRQTESASPREGI